MHKGEESLSLTYFLASRLNCLASLPPYLDVGFSFSDLSRLEPRLDLASSLASSLACSLVLTLALCDGPTLID